MKSKISLLVIDLKICHVGHFSEMEVHVPSPEGPVVVVPPVAASPVGCVIVDARLVVELLCSCLVLLPLLYVEFRNC